MQYIEIGYIRDTFGIKGQVKIKLDVYDSSEYRRKKALFLSKKGSPHKQYEVEKWEIRNESEAVLTFKAVTDMETAEALIGTTLFISEDELPKLAEGRYYYYEVIGFTVKDEKLGELGTVKDIWDSPGNDILVMMYKEKEVLIPMTDEIVLRADKENKQMLTNLPDGLLEMYLEG
ncbi:MAG: ribosome maturation factor RimM [Bacteroidia bacterium]